MTRAFQVRGQTETFPLAGIKEFSPNCLALLKFIRLIANYFKYQNKVNVTVDA